GVLRLRVLGHRRAPPLHRALGRRLARQRRRAEPAAVPVVLFLPLQLPPSSSTPGHHALELEFPGVHERTAVHEQLDVMAFGKALLLCTLVTVAVVITGTSTSAFFSAAFLLLPCCNRTVMSSVRSS